MSNNFEQGGFGEYTPEKIKISESVENGALVGEKKLSSGRRNRLGKLFRTGFMASVLAFSGLGGLSKSYGETSESETTMSEQVSREKSLEGGNNIEEGRDLDEIAIDIIHAIVNGENRLFVYNYSKETLLIYEVRNQRLVEVMELPEGKLANFTYGYDSANIVIQTHKKFWGTTKFSRQFVFVGGGPQAMAFDGQKAGKVKLYKIPYLRDIFEKTKYNLKDYSIVPNKEKHEQTIESEEKREEKIEAPDEKVEKKEEVIKRRASLLDISTGDGVETINYKGRGTVTIEAGDSSGMDFAVHTRIQPRVEDAAAMGELLSEDYALTIKELAQNDEKKFNAYVSDLSEKAYEILFLNSVLDELPNSRNKKGNEAGIIKSYLAEIKRDISKDYGKVLRELQTPEEQTASAERIAQENRKNIEEEKPLALQQEVQQVAPMEQIQQETKKISSQENQQQQEQTPVTKKNAKPASPEQIAEYEAGVAKNLRPDLEEYLIKEKGVSDIQGAVQEVKKVAGNIYMSNKAIEKIRSQEKTDDPDSIKQTANQIKKLENYMVAIKKPLIEKYGDVFVKQAPTEKSVSKKEAKEKIKKENKKESVKPAQKKSEKEVVLANKGKIVFKYNDKGDVVGVDYPKGARTMNYLDGNKLLKDNYLEILNKKRKTQDVSLARSAIQVDASDIYYMDKLLENMKRQGEEDSPEAYILKQYIADTIKRVENMYGDVFK